MSDRERAIELINNASEDCILYVISYLQNAETLNSETLEAMAEVEEMKRNPSLYKGYTDVDEMMKELLS